MFGEQFGEITEDFLFETHAAGLLSKRKRPVRVLKITGDSWNLLTHWLSSDRKLGSDFTPPQLAERPSSQNLEVRSTGFRR
jgi:hypothetical protein